MRTRLGPGPVFVYEWLTTMRRWQLYAVRSGFVGVILMGMVFILGINPITPSTEVSLGEIARYGQRLYLTIVSIELTVVLLVAPAATAGAICLDKARGTLDHVLTTDLSNGEIVLGKLFARLVPVAGLIACVLPIMALSSLLGGIDPDALFGSFLVALGCAVLSCSLALTLSVWGRKSQDVLMLTYLMIVLWVFGRYLAEQVSASTGSSSLKFLEPGLWDWLTFLNPYTLVWVPFSAPGKSIMASCLGFLGVCLGASGILVAGATWRIRAVTRAGGKQRRTGPGQRPTFQFHRLAWVPRLPGPSLDGNPVFWREWYRSKPSRLMRIVWVLYWLVGLIWVGAALKGIASGNIDMDMIILMNVFQVCLGLLLLSVHAVTSFAEERVRGSLESLLSTPLSTREILAGKWFGTFSRVPHLLFAPVLTTFFLAWDSGRWVFFVLFVGLMLAYSAAIVSLGLALATWQRRPGWAIALCVGIYAVFLVGWPALVLGLTSGPGANDHLIVTLIMGTPLWGIALGTGGVAAELRNMPDSRFGIWLGSTLWLAAFAGAAMWLYSMTVFTFDRFLGRMRELSWPVCPQSSDRTHPRQLAKAGPLMALLLLTSLGADAAGGLVNANLEEGKLGEVPTGWFLPGPSHEAGYRASLTEEQPKEGRRCAVLRRDDQHGRAGFGNLMQVLDVTSYRGKRIRFRAAVRADKDKKGTRAQLWLRVDRKGGKPGFFDNMGDRPIIEASWRDYEIVGDVAEDAESIALGLLLIGEGRVWLDAVSVEITGVIGEGNEPPRPLEKRELDNVVAFARLLGYVRYFHPSDQAAATDWDAFTIDGVRAVEKAKDAVELTDILQRLFLPIAPSVQIYPTGKPVPATVPSTPKPPSAVMLWRHLGVGLANSPIYSSKRIDIRKPGAAEPGPARQGLPAPDQPFTADLGGGCSCQMPIAVCADEKGTLPASGHLDAAKKTASALVVPRPQGYHPSGNDRATRLADVILAWNVFQHFYPYFDVVEADWPGELRKAPGRAAEDADERAFLKTLRRLVAAVHDGHGGVYGAGMSAMTFPPFGWDWVEGQLVITGVAAQGGGDLKPGDRVVEIGGRPTMMALAEAESMISGATPQWRLYRALIDLAAGENDSEMNLKVQVEVPEAEKNPQNQPPVRTIRVRRSLDMGPFQELQEPRPAKIMTVKPGVIYVDLGRITQPEFDKIVPQLAEARGIVFDLRGYPNGIEPQTIGHLIDHAVTCAQWHVPVTYFPDRRDVNFTFTNWAVRPALPRFQAKVAFLTDGRAISYAETYLGIIEHYKLADIVGGPTAGTNGNVNPFTLPGGYHVTWTGMKVLKHDGSRHHGVGIQPTVPAGRTISGVAAGRDEVLERAIAVVSPK